MSAYPIGRSDYRPGHARTGQPTPRSDPDLFSTEDLRAEASYLMALNRRHGTSTLRTLAYLDLLRTVGERLRP